MYIKLQFECSYNRNSILYMLQSRVIFSLFRISLVYFVFCVFVRTCARVCVFYYITLITDVTPLKTRAPNCTRANRSEILVHQSAYTYRKMTPDACSAPQTLPKSPWTLFLSRMFYQSFGHSKDKR